MKKFLVSKIKNVFAIVCSFIILCSIIGLILLGIGVKNADKTGTFNIFGKSYHLMQANDMSPVIEENGMIVVKHTAPTSFSQGDVVAFYYGEADEQYILIRRLTKMDGMKYTLADQKGKEMVISASETRFLGIVDSKSAFFGKMVLFLQSEDGKTIFLWWSLGILFFIVGVAMMLHVIMKNMNPKYTKKSFEEKKGFDFNSIDFD